MSHEEGCVTKMLINLVLPSLQQRRELNKLVFIFKIAGSMMKYFQWFRMPKLIAEAILDTVCVMCSSCDLENVRDTRLSSNKSI